MAKPIFIVRIPIEINSDEDRRLLENVSKDLQTKISDYHVLVFAENRNDANGIQFECYNTEAMPSIEIDELIEQINNIIKI